MKHRWAALTAVLGLLAPRPGGRAPAQAVATLKGHRGTITCLAFAPDGKALASGGKDGAVILWDVAAAAARATLPGHKDTATAVALPTTLARTCGTP